MARSTCVSRLRWTETRILWTVDGAIPSRQANCTGPSLRRKRKLIQRFAILAMVLFGERWGRELLSCMDWPLR